MSATSAQFFRYLWNVPSSGVPSPSPTIPDIDLKKQILLTNFSLGRVPQKQISFSKKAITEKVHKPYQHNLINSNLSLAYPSKSHVVLPNNAFFPTYHVLRKGKETIGFFRPTEQKPSLQKPNNCMKNRGSPFSVVYGSPGNRTIRKTELTVFWFNTKMTIWDF